MASERERLAACPLCAGKAEIRRTRSKVWPMFAAQCTNEDCLASVLGYTEEEATTRWNRRASAPPADVGTMAALSALLESIRDTPGGFTEHVKYSAICQAADALAALARERDRLRSELSAAIGYMTNAAIDLDTNTPKRTTKATIDGGIKRARAALGGSDA